MFRRLLAPVLIVAALGACSKSEAPADTTAPAANAPAPVTPAADAAPAAAATTAAATPATTETPGASNPLAGTAAVDPNAPPPRPGTDFEALQVPQPTFSANDGRIEIAEVFSYMCIHCAEFQPAVDQYKPTLAADAKWVYVPAAFGGPWDQAARAYYSAELLGLADRTHTAVFDAIFVKQKVKTGSAEDFADLYASLGADRARFLATMSSFGVTAKLSRGKQFSMRTGVNATPTIIINGKYKVMNTRDRGIKGMLDTVTWVIAQERAAAAAATAPVPVPAA